LNPCAGSMPLYEQVIHRDDFGMTVMFFPD
jgi:hypothetical protein